VPRSAPAVPNCYARFFQWQIQRLASQPPDHQCIPRTQYVDCRRHLVPVYAVFGEFVGSYGFCKMRRLHFVHTQVDCFSPLLVAPDKRLHHCLRMTGVASILTKRSQYGLSIRGGTTGRYPILRMNCQQDGRVVLRDLQYVDLDEATAQSFRVNRSDILFNRTNSYELVGRTAIVDDDIDAVFASYLIRLSIDDERLMPTYLNYFLNWDFAQSKLKKLASRAVGQANIDATKLSGFTVPVPLIDEQQDIVAILGAINKKIDLHRKKRAVLDELFRAVLLKLMTGEIRVTDLDLSALAPARVAEGAQ
jgi:Type I restriction modification DNA specificity domain